MAQDEKPDNEEKKVIVKFLVWYESLNPEERLIFEAQLGNAIRVGVHSR